MTVANQIFQIWGAVSRLLDQPDSALVSADAARRLELNEESPFILNVHEKRHQLNVMILPESDETLIPDNTIFVDIATAQNLFERSGWLSRIDLVLDF